MSREPAVELSVRKADEADLTDVMTLRDRCVDDMLRRGIEQWDDIYPTLEWFTADVSAGSLHIASVDNQIVGAFALNEKQDPEYVEVPWTFVDERVAVVHRLMVDPSAQGRGIARKLMRHAELLAAELGFGAVRLDAFTLNPQALRLYASLGYRDAGGVQLRKGVFRCFEKRLGPAPPNSAG